MGAVFGGSSSTVFGSSGAGNFLTRLTTATAIVFMLTSLSLTYFSARRNTATVFDSAPRAAADALPMRRRSGVRRGPCSQAGPRNRRRTRRLLPGSAPVEPAAQWNPPRISDLPTRGWRNWQTR